MRRGLILVEGQTEEQFVKRVLSPYLQGRGLHLQPTLVTTKKVKNGPDFKGGIVSFGQLERDLRALLGDSSAAVVTTMFDLYGLPRDVPGIVDAGARRGVAKAEWVIQSLREYFGSPQNLRIFVTVHEYEGLLFSDPTTLANALAAPHTASALRDERMRFATPEDINDGPDTHPSRRVTRCCPTYRKRLHGVQAIEQIGLERIRAECPHFHTWITDLELLAAQS